MEEGELAGLLHLDYDVSSPRPTSPGPGASSGGPEGAVVVDLGREGGSRRPVHSSSTGGGALPVRARNLRPEARGQRQRMSWQRFAMGASGLALVLLGVGLFGNTVTNVLLGL